MGFRFRRSLKIAPGIRLNFGKRGTSLSLGGRGFTTNISKRGAKTTVGLPGTGISYSTISPRKKKRRSLQQPVIDGPPAPSTSALVKALKITFFFLLAMLIAATLGTLSRFT